MIASVYIKDGNICFYNEDRTFTDLGGFAYELGRPLLDFICYEHDRFDESFAMQAEAFDDDYAHMSVRDPGYIVQMKESMREAQLKEIYVYFYFRILLEFVCTFVDSPRQAIEQLEDQLPGAEEKLHWTIDFEWPTSNSPYIVAHYADKERRLYRAALDVVSLMSKHFKSAQSVVIQEVEWLIYFREMVVENPPPKPISSPMEFLYFLEVCNQEHFGMYFFLEKPFHAFYGVINEPEIVELYEIRSIRDLVQFEFVKMIEHDIFIKKCKNCERFFIPRRRADAEYCNRIFADNGKRCSEVGAMLRYEKKVAENPVLEAYKKAYRRLHSRTRNKKMTQSEFMKWSDDAAKKRDACLAGEMPFGDFVAWLEQGRIRKSRGENKLAEMENPS